MKRFHYLRHIKKHIKSDNLNGLKMVSNPHYSESDKLDPIDKLWVDYYQSLYEKGLLI